jgi:hypothetical protein
MYRVTLRDSSIRPTLLDHPAPPFRATRAWMASYKEARNERHDDKDGRALLLVAAIGSLYVALIHEHETPESNGDLHGRSIC